MDRRDGFREMPGEVATAKSVSLNASKGKIT
jgi:hypothetical protein